MNLNEGLMISVLFVLMASVRMATPLILGALGGMFSERSGVVNIAIEGLMLLGAFSAATISYYTGSAWIGLLAAIVVGALFAGIHALMSVQLAGDQTVSGTAINMLGASLTVYFMRVFFGSEGQTPSVPKLPSWGIGEAVFNPVTYLAVILVIVAWFVLFKTRYGLHIRAVGEHPETADTMGIRVGKVRTLAVLISGMLAGLGGAYLSIGDGSYFLRGMTSGRGFMALAILILGKWHPVGILIAALLFGMAEAVQIVLAGSVEIPSQLLGMIPYVVTLLALAGFMGKSVAPSAIGKPYVKGN